MRDKGVLLSTDGPDHNVIKIKPPLVFGPVDTDQLIEALRHEAANPAPKVDGKTNLVTEKPASAESTRSARWHGKKLLEGGYSVDQVVHDYGDVCQAITELALEQQAPITVKEFHTLNRCLDTAIAEAVTEHARVDSQRTR